MSTAPTRPDDAIDPERIERRSRALQGLAEAGLELTRALVDEVVTGREGRFRGVDPALAYSRLARAVRLAVALEARLWEAPADAARTGACAADADESAVETEAAEGCERSEAERPESERPESERPESERPERERLREAPDAPLLIPPMNRP